MAVTTIEYLKSVAGAQEVTLSGWTPDVPFVCKLRRPGLFELAISGRVPNPLLAKAAELFTGDPSRIAKVDLAEQATILRGLARAALIEPSAAELDENGITLTDAQYTEIYAWVLGGVTGLESFRTGIRRAAGVDGKEVRRTAERDTET